MVVKYTDIMGREAPVSSEISTMNKTEYGYNKKIGVSSTEEIWRYWLWGRNTLGERRHDKMDCLVFVLTGRVRVAFSENEHVTLEPDASLCLPKGKTYVIESLLGDSEFLCVYPVGYQDRMKQLSPPVVLTNITTDARPIESVAMRPHKILSLQEREARAAQLAAQQKAHENARAQTALATLTGPGVPVAKSSLVTESALKDYDAYNAAPPITLDLRKPAPAAPEVKPETPVAAPGSSGGAVDAFSKDF